MSSPPDPMGAREYLFLWAHALEQKWPWPEVLQTACYNARTDRLHVQVPYRPVGSLLMIVEREDTFVLSVTGETQTSGDTIRKHGYTWAEIEEALCSWHFEREQKETVR